MTFPRVNTTLHLEEGTVIFDVQDRGDWVEVVVFMSKDTEAKLMVSSINFALKDLLQRAIPVSSAEAKKSVRGRITIEDVPTESDTETVVEEKKEVLNRKLSWSAAHDINSFMGDW